MQDRYVLGVDEMAARRLRVLDDVYGPASRALLERGGLCPGLRCADIGCGTGSMTLAMAERVGPQGKVIGIDPVELFLTEARQRAQRQRLEQIEFKAGAVGDLPLSAGSFDLVYSRCLLSHLANPLEALRSMVGLVRPGGHVCLEDIDCGGVFVHPEMPGLMQHQDWYQRLVRLHGGDPLMGRKLPRFCRQLGLSEVRFAVVAPNEPLQAVKELYPLTLNCMKPSIVSAGLAAAAEVDRLVTELTGIAQDPARKLSSCPMVQVWARRL